MSQLLLELSLFDAGRNGDTMIQQLEIREQHDSHGIGTIRVVVIEDDHTGPPKGVYVISTPIRAASNWSRRDPVPENTPAISVVSHQIPAPPSISLKRGPLGLCTWRAHTDQRAKSGYALTRRHAEMRAERWLDEQRWSDSDIGSLCLTLVGRPNHGG